MSQDKIRDILKSAIARSVQPGSSPRDVLKVLRKQHPDLKSRDFALAAFAVMIEVADSDADLATALHEVGLSERGEHDAA